MLERPRLDLENPTRRARLRSIRREAAGLTPRLVTKKKLDNVHSHRNVRPDGLPLTKTHSVRISDVTPHMPKQAKSRVLKRHMPKPDYKTYPKHKRPMTRSLAGVIAIMVVSVGILGSALFVRNSNPIVAQNDSQQSVLGSIVTGASVSETEPPKDLSEHKVSPESPRFLIIDKIGVRARVGSVGMEAANTLSAPANIFDVGWYTSSKKPGEPGAIVINGHVSGSTKRGVFYSIGTLKPGDDLVIERGDGKKFTYTVKETAIYDNDKVDMDKILTSLEPGKPALNLISSTGRFNVRTNQFEQRVAVYALQD
jgi:sortase (surface protein transpeptidase)